MNYAGKRFCEPKAVSLFCQLYCYLPSCTPLIRCLNHPQAFSYDTQTILSVTVLSPQFSPICISPPNARFTLADPTPRLCPDAVGSAKGFPTWHRLSGHHPETIGWSSGNIKPSCLILPDAANRSGAERVQCNCLSQGVVINKTPSPYQPYAKSLLPHVNPIS